MFDEMFNEKNNNDRKLAFEHALEQNNIPKDSDKSLTMNVYLDDDYDINNLDKSKEYWYALGLVIGGIMVLTRTYKAFSILIDVCISDSIKEYLNKQNDLTWSMQSINKYYSKLSIKSNSNESN